ncbi:MAG: SLATT domain-containing protein, partial [Elainellaceae cyanobacterium]
SRTLKHIAAIPMINLLPDEYISRRLEANLNWYREKSRKLEQRLQLFRLLVYALGGLGALLAVMGFQLWVATTTAAAAMLIYYQEMRVIEPSQVSYDKAADALFNIRTWWTSLSEEERQQWKKFEILIEETEETIRIEHASWLHDIQVKLSRMYNQMDAQGDFIA